MGLLNSQKGIFRFSFIIFLTFIFCLVSGATIIPDNTTIVGDVTIQSTNGIDINPGSDTNTDLISIGVTGSPKISWNETEDALQFIEKLIIGTNASLTKTINASSYVSKMALDTDTSTDSGGIDITRHGSSDASYGVINMSRSRGTHASPTIVQSGDLIGSLTGLGYDGVDFEPAASIQMYSDGTPGSNDMPGRIDFKTVADGSRVLNQVMRLGQNTDVMIGTTTSAASSILEVQSVTRGSRPAPRMQQTERDAIASPATGLMVYNTDFNTYNFYNGSGWKDLISTSATQSMSNKTVTDALKFQETGGGTDYIAFQAPSSVASSVTFTLPSTDGSSGQALKTDGAGTLSWGTAGSGSGGVNYIDNPDAETNTTGWATYADAAGTSPVNGTGGTATTTWTRTTSSPLRGTGSFLLTKDAANRQGEGASYDFTIAAADKAKVLQISFSYIVGSGTFTAGTSSTDSDVTVWIYDVTNSRLIQPSTYKLLSNSTSIASLFEATFQTASDSTSYRLILHVGSTSASAYTVKFDDVKVSPSVYVYGTPVTDWQTFTPTGSWVSNTTYSGKFRKVGQDMQIIYKIALSGAPTATPLLVDMPSGYTINNTIIDSTTYGQSTGHGNILDASGPSVYNVWPIYIGTTQFQVIYSSDVVQGSGSGVSSTAPITFASGDIIDLFIQVPIVGWSSSVQMSDSTASTVVATILSGSSTSITSSNDAIVPTTVVTDTFGSFSGSTYTVRVPGIYELNAYMSGPSASYTSTQAVTVSFRKNGSFVASLGLARAQTSITTSLSASGSAKVYCNVGDTLQFYGSSDVTGTISSFYASISRLSGPSTIAATESVIARYTTTAGTSFGTSFAVLDFATKSFDSTSAVTTGASWKFTAPISGKYRVTLGLTTASFTGASGNGVAAKIYKNAAAYSRLGLELSEAGVTTYKFISGSDVVELLAGDYIDIRIARDSGITVSLSTTSGDNYITVQRVANY